MRAACATRSASSVAALLIVDEIGFLPVVPDGRYLSFRLVNARHERGAMILTSIRGFAGRVEVFGNRVVATTSSIGSRITPSVQIDRSSYRLRQHAEFVPEHLRAKAL